MNRKERLSFSQKNANGKKWYKEKIDELSSYRVSEDDRLKMKVNFDLYNNIIDTEEFNYVCMPFGKEVGKLPANLQNRDIVSGKVKTLLGMEMQRPFTYKVFSTNPEATTEKERKHFGMIKEYVVQSIMAPIEQQIAAMQEQQLQQLQGLPQEQVEQAMQEMEQQAEQMKEQMTPPEIKKYMAREYQDPAEILSSQLLEYLKYKLDLKAQFSDMFRNGLLTAKSVMYIGILNGEPTVKVVNPLDFTFAKSANTDFIEDSEWAMCEYRMTPTQIVQHFSKELKDKEIDAIYDRGSGYSDGEINLFSGEKSDESISVFHCTWKSLRKLGFLRYLDEVGELQTEIVDEHYVPQEDLGEVEIEWEWIPEVYEGWKIDITEPIYVNMRPMPGQFKDLDNIRVAKLPYYGVVYDAYNSDETSLMDRIKYYQYLYNIIMYRLELLMASDKGKKLLMNINNVPDSLGIDVKKWQYFVESTPYVWYNPAEEGGMTQDANTVAKVLDLSLVSDIKKYIEIAEYIKQQCGKSVGITEQVEGQIGQYEAVRNTNQALIQSSYILEPYFLLHDRNKVNILTALLEMAKVCYSKEKPVKLSYVLDDMSKESITIEPGVLDNSTLGIFISSSSKTEKTKDLIMQLAQAALQNQTVEFSDIISVMNAESVPEAKEVLTLAEQKRQEMLMQQQQQQQQHEQEMQQQMAQAKQQEFEMQKELTVLKEEERRKTEVVKMSLMGASYNPDHDGDKDGINDFVEIAKLQLEKYSREEDLKMRRDELTLKQQEQAEDSQRQTALANAQMKQYKMKKAHSVR